MEAIKSVEVDELRYELFRGDNGHLRICYVDIETGNVLPELLEFPSDEMALAKFDALIQKAASA